MKVLHGSCVDFNEFNIDKASSTYLAEGKGVYMTDLEAVANQYGSIIYTIELDDDNVSDFTNKEYIHALYKKISYNIGVDFYNEINIDSFVDSILSGDASILDSSREIYNIMDNDYNIYSKYEDMMDDMHDIIEKSFLENIKDIIKYKAKDIDGNIFMCFRNENRLAIVSKIANI